MKRLTAKEMAASKAKETKTERRSTKRPVKARHPDPALRSLAAALSDPGAEEFHLQVQRGESYGRITPEMLQAQAACNEQHKGYAIGGAPPTKARRPAKESSPPLADAAKKLCEAAALARLAAMQRKLGTYAARGDEHRRSQALGSSVSAFPDYDAGPVMGGSQSAPPINPSPTPPNGLSVRLQALDMIVETVEHTAGRIGVLTGALCGQSPSAGCGASVGTAEKSGLLAELDKREVRLAAALDRVSACLASLESLAS